MSSPFPKGRMISRKIRSSDKFASLSKDSMILFCMVLPHLNSYGKLNGEPNFIKGECVPKIKFFTIKKISECMKEINQKTNMKYFKLNGLWYVHALSFSNHQKLEKLKMGIDDLPSHGVVLDQSPTSLRPVAHEVEVEVEVKEEVEDKDKEAFFDVLWEKYPNKDGRKQALKSFLASIKTERGMERITQALNNYLSSDRVKKGYIKNGSTWFNNWQDWIEYKDPKPSEEEIPEYARKENAI